MARGPFASGYSERSEESESAQDKLREAVYDDITLLRNYVFTYLRQTGRFADRISRWTFSLYYSLLLIKRGKLVFWEGVWLLTYAKRKLIINKFYLLIMVYSDQTSFATIGYE